MNKKAIIIGAGVGGLASAIRLRLKGYAVQVLEANAAPGGKLAEFTIGAGYRFDAGPSLFTLPEQMEALFALAGKKTADYFEYDQLEIICKYFYEDGTRIRAWNDPERFAKEIENQTDETADNVLAALKKSKKMYDITHHVFLERSLHKVSTYTRKDTLISMAKLPAIDPFRTMAKANADQFSDPRIVQLFNRYATYNGSDPYQAPATLNVIPHLEFNMGAFLPKGGLIAIPQSLFKLAKDLGVEFHFGTKVSRILYEKGEAKGVEYVSQAITSLMDGLVGKGEGIHDQHEQIEAAQMKADVVVSNMDVMPTYRRLLRDQPAPERTLKQPRSSSALIFYWGMNKTFPDLDLHNIFFSKEYEAEFEHIWKKKDIYHDPTVYLFASSKLLPEDAPEGCENWFVMINVPANDGSQDWDALIPLARKHIIAKLEGILGEEIEAHIEAEEILDPRGIESRTASYQGALYGSSSNNMWAAFLRHPNFSSKIANLYFCGGSVHPGGGIPLSLLSAKIVGDMV
ncbi:MAG: phytoene desaturase family protein [Bacteroidia bacterium]